MLDRHVAPSAGGWAAVRPPLRSKPLLTAVVGIVGLVLIAAPGVAAEPSLLQKLFGWGGPASPPPPALPRIAAPPVQLSVHRGRDTLVPYAPGRDAAEPAAASGPASPRYRTLCVRLCDGYFFPISDRATRRQFYRDSEACHARCGGDVRLFYHPTTGGDTASMVDLGGLAYAHLAVAYKYRKQAVAGCRCNPEPWEASERARHQSYAEAAARAGAEASAEPQSPAAEAGVGAMLPAAAAATVAGPPLPSTFIISDERGTEPPPAVAPPPVAGRSPDPIVEPAQARAAEARSVTKAAKGAAAAGPKPNQRIFISDGKGGWTQVSKPPSGARLLGERAGERPPVRSRKLQRATAPRASAGVRLSLSPSRARGPV